MIGKSTKGIKAAIVLLLLIVMTACGSVANNKGNTEQSSEQNSSSSQQKVDKNNDVDTTEVATRVVMGEFGEVTIPVNPKRVAGIYVEDYLKALDVEPVVQWYNPMWGTQEYLKLDAPLFDVTGSLEALMAEDPDLIILDGGGDKEKYDQYSKIAPTFRIPDEALSSSEEMLKAVADVLGIPEKAESVLAQYQEDVEAAKVKFEQAIGKETVAVIRVNTGDKTIALFGIKNRFVGELYSKFGLEPHQLVKDMENFQEILSEEAFATLDADHIIVLVSNGDWNSPENADSIELLDSPLWKAVPAFANDHVYKVERSHWQSGAIYSNFLKLDDLLKLLVKE
ncbi:MAG: ABC transporter substrate-binding protein [Candidatus Pristimantibacillus lignocellulolyticus]|uniref:ABC transporter substrate-binding protein n=1 Tax=Candidatus Pristimantibacillus lignocellulolyticus TaxID=2994561 RepID=A0A9J6ZIX4_9BACL|nr:MAG: ABC transporter substrate-binding protein [Candidatus Pristimantibacillus lignocellulolyticus]